jgi:hypothetical protein
MVLNLVVGGRRRVRDDDPDLVLTRSAFSIASRPQASRLQVVPRRKRCDGTHRDRQDQRMDGVQGQQKH